MGATIYFRDAVSKNDTIGIRIMMSDGLLIDPTFKDFEVMKRLSKNVPGLYDKHDGVELNYDESTWNDDYMDTLMVQVLYNFSHERLNLLKAIVRKTRPVKPKTYNSNYDKRNDLNSYVDNFGMIEKMQNGEKEPKDIIKTVKEWAEQITEGNETLSNIKPSYDMFNREVQRALSDLDREYKHYDNEDAGLSNTETLKNDLNLQIKAIKGFISFSKEIINCKQKVAEKQINAGKHAIINGIK